VQRQSESAHMAQRRSGKRGPREGHVSCVCLYNGIGLVSWTGGIQVSTRRNEGHQRTLAMRLHVCGGQHYSGALMVRIRSRQRGRQREALSSSSWRGIPTGAATGGSRAVGSIDTMRWLTMAGGQVDIKVVRALDGWPA
jgi:hypothetical protein